MFRVCHELCVHQLLMKLLRNLSSLKLQSTFFASISLPAPSSLLFLSPSLPLSLPLSRLLFLFPLPPSNLCLLAILGPCAHQQS